MSTKFTAVYLDSWFSASQWHSLTKIRRVVQQDDESVLEMLEREGIARVTLFLFQGHPPLQGEPSEESVLDQLERSLIETRESYVSGASGQIAECAIVPSVLDGVLETLRLLRKAGS